LHSATSTATPRRSGLQSALAFDVVDVARITRMLKTAAKPTSPERNDGKVVQLHCALRAARAALRTRTSNKKEDV